MASRQVKDGVLCPDAIITDVRILIHHTLLLLAQTIDHLAHTVNRLRHHDALGDFMLLVVLGFVFLNGLFILTLLCDTPMGFNDELRG